MKIYLPCARVWKKHIDDCDSVKCHYNCYKVCTAQPNRERGKIILNKKAGMVYIV